MIQGERFNNREATSVENEVVGCSMSSPAATWRSLVTDGVAAARSQRGVEQTGSPVPKDLPGHSFMNALQTYGFPRWSRGMIFIITRV